MITYKKGNIFESNCSALVNPVNTMGKMGKGLALEFKKRFPATYQEYVRLCYQERVRIGEVIGYQDRYIDRGMSTPIWIVNFPTKQHWRNPSSLYWIELGLESLKDFIQQHKLSSIAIPALGCGEGGLDWHEVRKLIDVTLSTLGSVNIVVYEPN